MELNKKKIIVIGHIAIDSVLTAAIQEKYGDDVEIMTSSEAEKLGLNSMPVQNKTKQLREEIENMTLPKLQSGKVDSFEKSNPINAILKKRNW